MSEKMQMRDATLTELVGEQLSSMRGWRGRRLRRVWSRASEDERLEICDQFCEEVCLDPGCYGSSVQVLLSADGFDHSEPMRFDPQTLREILDLLLEYLPQIIGLFSVQKRREDRERFFGLVQASAVLLAVGLLLGMGQTASAQVFSKDQCEGGVCRLCPQSASVPRVVSPVRSPEPRYIPAPGVVSAPVIPSRSPLVDSCGCGEVCPCLVDDGTRLTGPVRRVVAAQPVRSVVRARPLRTFGSRLRSFRQRFGILPRLFGRL